MYHVEITNEGGSAFTARSKDSQFIIDTNGAGVTPPDALLASLGACIGVYLRKYCEGAGMAVPAFKVTVEGDLEKGPPSCFRKIRASVDIKGAAMDERRRASLAQFIRNCPVHNTLKGGPDVSIEVRQT